MKQEELNGVAAKAAGERGCSVFSLMFNDDDNVFEIVLERNDASAVDLEDCEYVHRAILSAFDRNVEDYSLTVGSRGIDAAQADEILKTINDK